MKKNKIPNYDEFELSQEEIELLKSMDKWNIASIIIGSISITISIIILVFL